MVEISTDRQYPILDSVRRFARTGCRPRLCFLTPMEKRSLNFTA